MDTKLKVLTLSLSIVCCLISNIEAHRNDMRPKEEEISGVQVETRQEQVGRRESRKLKLFDIWNKPKTSPLFLINGTVCRFVNSSPICTNLSTTGLFPPNQSNNNFRQPTNPNSNNQFGGQAQTQDQNFNQNQNQQNQNQNPQNQNQNQNPQNQNQFQIPNQQNQNQQNQRPNG